MPLLTGITIISWLAMIAYAVLLYAWYTAVGSVSIESSLLVICFVAACGLIARKEWARKTTLVANGALLLFNIVDIFFISRQLQPLPLVVATWSLILIVTFVRPETRRIFQLGQSKQWKVLLVDDDQTFLRLIGRHLSNLGMAVLTAETGEAGLELARQEAPDLILLDIILPGLKGREVCDRLKEEGRTREIPVVFLTYKDSKDDMRAAMEGGAVAYLTKPINFQELTDTIQKVLGK